MAASVAIATSAVFSAEGSRTWSHAHSGGSLVLFAIVANGGGKPLAVSATFNGVSADVRPVVDVTGSRAEIGLNIFVWNNVPAVTANVYLEFNTTAYGKAYAATVQDGAATITLENTAAYSTGASVEAYSNSIGALGSNRLVLDMIGVIGDRSLTLTRDAGQALVSAPEFGTAWLTCAGSSKLGSASVTMGWTWTTGVDANQLFAAFYSAAASQTINTITDPIVDGAVGASGSYSGFSVTPASLAIETTSGAFAKAMTSFVAAAGLFAFDVPALPISLGTAWTPFSTTSWPIRAKLSAGAEVATRNIAHYPPPGYTALEITGIWSTTNANSFAYGWDAGAPLTSQLVYPTAADFIINPATGEFELNQVTGTIQFWLWDVSDGLIKSFTWFMGSGISPLPGEPAAATATAQGAFTTAIPLDGGGSATATAQADITTSGAISGDAGGVATAEAAMSIAAEMSGAAGGEATAQADATTGITMTANALNDAVARADLSTGITLSGGAGGAATAASEGISTDVHYVTPSTRLLRIAGLNRLLEVE